MFISMHECLPASTGVTKLADHLEQSQKLQVAENEMFYLQSIIERNPTVQKKSVL